MTIARIDLRHQDFSRNGRPSDSFIVTGAAAQAPDLTTRLTSAKATGRAEGVTYRALAGSAQSPATRR